ncbi:cytochrome P450 [Schizophyllum amplum]|uniref:Cytochrome P450 n=1 Tax=Schizophyllum amplum TaxID=97359 RepID=A0A550BY06_9AGAR|nr:cytochrome P450 [Auriculariopsis ampla]
MAPPIVGLLIKALPALALPSIITCGCLRALENVREVKLPIWMTVTILVVVHPMLSIFHAFRDDWQMHSKAAANAAVVAPLLPSKLPFGLSHIKTVRDGVRSGVFAHVMGAWVKEMGATVFRVNLLGTVQFVTTEPDHVKAILATQFEDFDKGPLTYDQVKSLLGSGVFNSDGDMWKFHRTMTRPFFNKDKIAHFDNFDRHADHIIRLAKERIAEGYPIDFQDMVARFTLDSATEYLFGHDVNSIGAGLPYPPDAPKSNPPEFFTHSSNRFVKAFGEGQTLSAMRIQVGSSGWRLFEALKDKVQPCRDVVDELVNEILADLAREKDSEAQKATSDAKPGEDDTLLSYLVKYTQDRRVLADEIVNLLVAGRDTTAGTLSFGIYKLAEHPDVLVKLREEILDKVGPTRRPTYEDIRDMKYLRAFLNEILRLYPVVPVNDRQANKDTLLPFKDANKPPVFVPNGSRVKYSVYLMHRRTDLWGPDAGTFDPDRFIDERLGKYLTHNPFIFVPFNAGPRICLGQQFAYNEMSFFLIRLLQNFSGFSLADDVQPADTITSFPTSDAPGAEVEKRVFAAHLTMYLKDSLWVRMTEAPAAEKNA